MRFDEVDVVQLITHLDKQHLRLLLGTPIAALCRPVPALPWPSVAPIYTTLALISNPLALPLSVVIARLMLCYGCVIHKPAPTWPTITLMIKFVCNVIS